MSEFIIVGQSLISDMKQYLKGQPPEVIGIVLTELSATFLASYAPELRAEQCELLCKAIKELTPVIVSEMVECGIVPDDWSNVTLH